MPFADWQFVGHGLHGSLAATPVGFVRQRRVGPLGLAIVDDEANDSVFCGYGVHTFYLLIGTCELVDSSIL